MSNEKSRGKKVNEMEKNNDGFPNGWKIQSDSWKG